MSRGALLLAALAGSGLVLWTSPREATNYMVSPDAVEYAVSAHRLVTLGTYDIGLNELSYPPRYPPWFSVGVVAPAYVVLGPELGNGIVGVTLFAVAGVLVATLLGWRLGGPLGGAFAPVALLLIPEYRYYSGQIMTDVPAATLVLLAALLYLKVRQADEGRLRPWIASGIVIAGAAALRPLSVAVALPFFLHALRSGRPSTKGARTLTALRLSAVSTPAMLVGLGTLTYNALRFGSPFRSGYHLWSAVPYDYRSLLMGLGYLRENARSLLEAGTLPLLLLCVLASWAVDRVRRRADLPEGGSVLEPPGRTPLCQLAGFGLVGLSPLVVFHLFYFFPDARFYLPLLAITAVALGVMVARSVQAGQPRSWLLGVATLLLLGALNLNQSTDRDAFPRREIAERLLRRTPENALVVTQVDAAYLDPLLLRGSAREAIPYDRTAEYASKIVVRTRIADPHPAPRDAWDVRAAGLLAGAEEPVPWVAIEDLPRLWAAVEAGRPVFVDVESVGTDALGRLENRFVFVEMERGLLRMIPR